MNILAIMGSSRRNQNTEVMLNSFLSGMGLEHTQVIIPSEMDIKHCIACGVCGKTGKCVLIDDMATFYEAIPKADALVFATPVYFNSVPGMTKNLVDRCQVFWSQKYILNQEGPGNKKRPAFVLGNGGAPFEIEQFKGLQLVADYFFKACNFHLKGQYFLSETDSRKVSNQEDLIKEITFLGRHWQDEGTYCIQR